MSFAIFIHGDDLRRAAVGVVVEACVVCANNYGVADDLRALDIDVKPIGVPLSDRLKGPWKVITF